jgi:TP901 family phage tail tape measure protein
MSAGAIRAGRTVIEIGADPKAYLEALDRLKKHIRNVGVQINNAGVAMVGLGAAATAPFIGALRQSASFQDTMAAVAAITDATGAEFDALKKKALDLGATTSFSAQQVAEGMQALGQGGFSVEETLKGIDGALLLARAGMLDLGQATSITVAILRSFSMPTSEAAKVADVLAKAANSSNASVESLGEALSTVSGIAAGVGASLNEVTAAIGTLADRGMDGTNAGTALRRVFIGLSQEQAKLKDLGVEVKDPKSGKLKPLVAIIRDLKQGLDAAFGNDETAKLSSLTKIFDVFGANAVYQLMGATDSLEALTGTLSNSDGAARKAAAIMDNTLGGSFRLLRSAVEAVALGVGDQLTPAVREWSGYLTRLAAGIATAVGRNGELVVAIAKAAVGAVGAGVAMLTLGTSIRVVAFSLGGLTMAARAVLSPLTLTVRTATLLSTTLIRTTRDVVGFASGGIGALVGFANRSGMALARATAGFGVLAVESSISAGRVAASMTGTALAGVLRFTQASTVALAQYAARSTALVAVSAAAAGAMGTAQVATTVSVISATVARAAEGNVRAAAIGVQALTRLGVAGTTNALVAGAQVARLSAQGSTQLIRLGQTGSTALATIGTTAIATGATAGNALTRAGSRVTVTLLRTSAAGVASMATIATSAVTASASMIASMARATAASIVQAATMAAAYALPFAGIAAGIGVAAVGIVGLATKIGGMGNVGGEAFGKVSAGLQAVGADARKMFGELAGVATTTFQGVSDAITAGELSIAFDVLWAGLQASWATGQNTVMGYVDGFVEYVQNAWGNLQTGLIEAFMGSTDGISGMWESFTTGLYDIWTGGVDKIVEYWNAIVGPIKRVIDSIMSYFDGSMDYEQVAKNAKAANEAAKTARAGRTGDRKQERQGMADAATANLEKTRLRAGGAKEAAELVVRATQAATADELRAIEDRGKELQAEGLVTKEQYDRVSGAVDDQTLELDRTRAMKAQQDQKDAEARDAVAAANGGMTQESAKLDTAGTFNAAAIAGLGYSQNIAERTAKAAEETAKNTREMSAEVQA